MQASTEPVLVAPEAPTPATLLWGRCLAWLPACAIQGALIAWAAVVAQEYFAPLLVFPLLVGIGLGATTAGMTRMGQVGHRGTIAAGLLLAIAVAVVGQHYIRYRMDVVQTRNDAELFRKARQQFADLAQGQMPVPPDTFWEYMRWQAVRGRPLHVAHFVARDGMAWLTWAVDGLFVLAAAVAVVLPAVRQPYCNHCRSWFRTTRSGRLGDEVGRCMAALVGGTLPDRLAWVRYRILDCNGGCPPAELMLFCEDSQGNYSSNRFWLTAAGRSRMTEVLDQAGSQGPPTVPQGDDSSRPSMTKTPPP